MQLEVPQEIGEDEEELRSREALAEALPLSDRERQEGFEAPQIRVLVDKPLGHKALRLGEVLRVVHRDGHLRQDHRAGGKVEPVQVDVLHRGSEEVDRKDVGDPLDLLKQK